MVKALYTLRSLDTFIVVLRTLSYLLPSIQSNPDYSALILTNTDYATTKRVIGPRICAERVRRGISRRRFALMTGTSRSYLWKIETGAADVGIDVLIRIALAFDMRARDLIKF